ncbi:MAG TPA: ABC transporter permease [Actinocrinis sp.]|nr:ABC transporter permease [Actinocrinis sp.]
MAVTTLQLDDATAPDPTPPMGSDAKGRRRLRVAPNRKVAIGLGIMGFYILLAIVGPWLAPYDPSARSDALVQGPSGQHWLGTTQLGQDVFSQILAGARPVVLVGFLAGLIATVLSVLVGVTSGYLTGIAGESLSTVSNVFVVIPSLPLLIIITATIQNVSDIVVALLIGLTSWSWGARILRAQTLSLRRRDYVEAARATGEPAWRIILFEILPNLTAVIASGFVGTVIFAVLSEITLAFIGVAGSSDWNWGTILFWAQSEQALAQGAWWWFIPAGLAIAILGTGLSLLNFGIDEFVSPRLRSSGTTKIRTNSGRAVRMRVGFTPVLAEGPSRAAADPAAETVAGLRGGPGPSIDIDIDDPGAGTARTRAGRKDQGQ